MSSIAAPRRTRRQRWAAPGSPHDRIVAWARALLPVGIGLLTCLLVGAPLTTGGDVSFVLDKNKVEVAKERMRIQSATYRGEDGKGQPFALKAGSAVQKSSAEPIVRIDQLDGQLTTKDGPATLAAPAGRYDMNADKVMIDGAIAFRGPHGYTLNTHDATVDMKGQSMASGSAVTGTVRGGTFSADRMHADLDERTVVLDGRARLRILPRRAR